MKTKTKVFIGVGAALLFIALVAIGLIVGGGAYLYGRFNDPELKAKLTKAKTDGTAFGTAVDQNGCMEKGYTLQVPPDSFDVSNEKYINACLHASRPTPEFCTGVPFVLDRKWFDDECRKTGHNNNACTSAFIAKRNFCRMDNKE